MAKSGSFFGIRSGSTKSLTFARQRIGGKQVQVTKCRTSRRGTRNISVKQSSQTLKMCMLAMYWNRFPSIKTLYAYSDYVNQTYQMYDWGARDDPYNEYMTDNLRRYPFTVTSYPISGTSYCGLGDIICSRGHLGNRIQLSLQDGKYMIKQLGILIHDLDIKDMKELSFYLHSNYKLEYGEQYYILIVKNSLRFDGTINETNLDTATITMDVNNESDPGENEEGKMFINSDSILEARWNGGKLTINNDGILELSDGLKILQACLVRKYGNMTSTARFIVNQSALTLICTAESARESYYHTNNTVGSGHRDIDELLEGDGGNENKDHYARYLTKP